jgi:hypothetical protein
VLSAYGIRKCEHLVSPRLDEERFAPNRAEKCSFSSRGETGAPEAMIITSNQPVRLLNVTRVRLESDETRGFLGDFCKFHLSGRFMVHVAVNLRQLTLSLCTHYRTFRNPG